MDHTYGDYSEIVRQRILLLPPGGRMKDLPQELWHKSFVRTGAKKTGGPNLRILRLEADKPSNTITAFIFNKFVHPTENRYITPREAASIQGFPPDFVFKGTVTSIQLQVGNAVPAKLGEAIAAHVAAYLQKYRESNGTPKAISLFTGAGGLDLGFHKYFDIVSMNDCVPAFCDTLRANFKGSTIIEGNVAELSGKQLAVGQKIDIVFGGPPCQAFSAAGKQKGIDDPRGMMILEHIRIVKETRPELFVLENVPNLKAISKGKILEQALEQMDKIGYATEWYILNAADYGAPQLRRRLIIIGRKQKYKQPLGAPPATHAKTPGLLKLQPYVGIGEALKDLPEAKLRK